MENRQENIHQKGFNLSNSIREIENQSTYSTIKLGAKTVEDASIDLGSIAKIARTLWDKETIIRSLGSKDAATLRLVSEFFYDTSGIYKRLCEYFSHIYKYDWYLVPYVKEAKKEKVLNLFSEILEYLDNSKVKKMFSDISLKVLEYGSYYGYLKDEGESFSIQQLPTNYCRSRFLSNMDPVVEFDLRFFDSAFTDTVYRIKVLNLFPEEIRKGYIQYKNGTLKNIDTSSSTQAWLVLDPAYAFKINLNNSDIPYFSNVVPSIIDLDEAQDLDKKKMMQKLLKVIIQKLPLDKNGELVFDLDEARDIHNNAVLMLKRAIGVDVLTTFADVDVIDMADKSTVTTLDELKKVERGLFNQSGVSENLFNTDGNLSLEKSLTNDEAEVRDFIHQFQNITNKIIFNKFIKNRKKLDFKVFFLETTIYNYEKYSEKFRGLVQFGYSKVLPMIALGIPQSTILAMAHFENEILDIQSIMIPPLMSSTLSGKTILDTKNKTDGNKTQENIDGTDEKTIGRPPKEDDEKSDKTIQNEESMS